MIGIGSSQHPESGKAGQEAAHRALERLQKGDRAGWAIVFCGGRHAPESILDGVHSVLGCIPVVGGSAVGTISHDQMSYTGFECCVTVFPNRVPPPQIVMAGSFDDFDERTLGRRLGEKIRQVAQDDQCVLVFYDSIRASSPPVLYVGSHLTDGLYDGLDGKPVHLIGAGVIGDFQITQSHLFDGGGVVKRTAVAAVLPSVLRPHTTIMHGCYPVSPFLEITKIDGAVVYELNGRPAMEVLLESIGYDTNVFPHDPLSWVLALGEKHGDPYAAFDERHYVNRIIIGTDKTQGSVTLFEADFHVGSKVQIMTRDNATMLESVRHRTRGLQSGLKGKSPAWALYLDCAGRSCAFSGADHEEAQELLDTLGPVTPLLGFYSGVEIAPLIERSRPLDWTGVLTLFTYEES